MFLIRVHLIASVPGAHTGANMHEWGHMKLRKVCRERERVESVSPHSLAFQPPPVTVGGGPKKFVG